MPKRLGKFELPNKLTKIEEGATATYAKFIAEPFEAGYGHTVGNSLRRVLLSSIEGSAISVDQDRRSKPRVSEHRWRRRGCHRHRPEPQEGLVEFGKARADHAAGQGQSSRCRHRCRHSGRCEHHDRQSRPGHLHARQASNVRGRD
jgi:hypothetical protein